MKYQFQMIALTFLFNFIHASEYLVKQKVAYAYHGIANPDLNLAKAVTLEYSKFEDSLKQLILKCMPETFRQTIEEYKDKNVSETTPRLVIVKGESGSGKTVTAQAVAQELGSAYIYLTTLNLFCDSYIDTPQRVLKYAQELAKKNNAIIIIEDVENLRELGEHALEFLKFCRDENILIIANTCQKTFPNWLKQQAELITLESTVSDDLREEFIAYHMKSCKCDPALLKKWSQKIRHFKKYEIENFGTQACNSAYFTRNSKEVLEENFIAAHKRDIEIRKMWGEL